MTASRRPAPPPGRLRRLDGRAKIILLVAACFLCQYLPEPWLILWLAVLAALFLIRDMRAAGVTAMLRGGLYFILFWLAMTIGSDLLAGKTLQTAVAASLPLGGRLLSLTLVGMAFVGLSSPLETGRAAAWFLRPFVGQWAWKPALAIALTAWFLPQTLRLAGEVSAGMRARGLRLPLRTRLFLLVGTSLRILERKAAELAVGLASRRLDDWRSWR